MLEITGKTTNQEELSPEELLRSQLLPKTAGVMIRTMQSSMPLGFPRAWTIAGYLLLALAALFVGRIVYEETILTWTNGPQMVGFAMMHGAAPLILIAGFIGLPGGLLWMLISLVLLFRRQFRIPPVDWFPMVLLTFLAAMLFVPYETWEEFIVRTAGPSSYGGEFLVQAAAQDKRRFVTLLLRKGYDVNCETGGTTPLSGASVEGHEEMVSFLISKGAEVNRKNGLSGESALMAAAEMGQLGTVKVLLNNRADPCATDKEGRTAEGLARKYHHSDIAEFLSSRFHCKENVIAPPCVDSAFSACVH